MLTCITEQLLYGRIYVPTGRLDALYGLRLGDTSHALVSFVSLPAQPLFRSGVATSPHLASSFDSLPASSPVPLAYQSLNIAVQHDIGHWSSEYSYSLEDGMFGARILHNIGSRSDTAAGDHLATDAHDEGADLGSGSGLRGRFSAGAEAFFSAQERSAGGALAIAAVRAPDRG
jgi:distribution and morphology protein 10